MAIALDNSGEMRTDGTTGNATLSFTVSGTNRALVLVAFTTNNSITATYAGVSMTNIARVSNSNGWEMDLFLLLNPTIGANGATINLSTGGTRSGFVVASYTGVAQSGQPDSFATPAQVSSSPYSLPTTVIATGCWLVGGVVGNGTGSVSAGASTTLRNGVSVVASTSLGLLDSNGTVGTGSQSLNATLTGITNMIGAVMSLAPIVTVNSGAFMNFM